MTVFIVAGRRHTLHKASRQGAGLMTNEADNLDDAKTLLVEYTNETLARQAADRVCRRCFR